MTSKKPKLLIISHGFPPEVNASSVLVYNIFSHYKGDMEAIGRIVYTKTDPDFVPPCKSYYIKPPFKNKYLYYIHAKLSLRLRFINRIQMKRLVKKIKPDVIIGNFPEVEFFILAFEVAKELNIPFYSYFHDLWEENATDPYQKKLARKYEPQIIAYSKRVIACTEFQKDFLDKKYGIQAEVLYHPIPDEEIIPKKISPSNSVKKEIVFLGSVSGLMNTDALRVASKAIAKLPEEYTFVFLPIQDIPISSLEAKGMNTDRIEVRVVSRNELDNELQKASILLAPLSFKNGSENEVKTVFSNKLLKYLVTGKPILVFSPADSYHSTSARKNGWGYVVNEDSEEDFNLAVMKIMNDTSLQKSLIERAFEEATRRKASNEATKVLNWVEEDVNHQ
jgi:glycosyltransferase involved in cell wall biosynthesis